MGQKNPPAPPAPGKGKPKGKPKGNSDVQALHKKLTEKDKELKDVSSQLKELQEKQADQLSDESKKFEEMSEKVDKLTGEIATMNKEKRVAKLREAYPDIHPDLLVDKSDEEVEKLVKAQRKVSKSVYGDSEVFDQEALETPKDVDKAIENVKKDDSMTAVEKAARAFELKKVKNKLK